MLPCHPPIAAAAACCLPPKHPHFVNSSTSSPLCPGACTASSAHEIAAGRHSGLQFRVPRRHGVWQAAAAAVQPQARTVLKCSAADSGCAAAHCVRTCRPDRCGDSVSHGELGAAEMMFQRLRGSPFGQMHACQAWTPQPAGAPLTELRCRWHAVQVGPPAGLLKGKTPEQWTARQVAEQVRTSREPRAASEPRHHTCSALLPTAEPGVSRTISMRFCSSFAHNTDPPLAATAGAH